MSESKARIAVVGPGRMGIGISQVFAYAGHKVDVIDVKERSGADSKRVFEHAIAQIEHNLTFMASCQLMEPSMVIPILRQIDFYDSGGLETALPHADVIFEAVPEIVEVKENTFAAICSAASDTALIASTTSTFMVESLAEFVSVPERFLNTHWLNPAYLMPLVEVSPGAKTAPEALQAMMNLLKSAGKVPVQCAASPGFIVPRIQALAMNEAARLAEEGVASPEAIDTASRIGFGLRFAVFGLLEFIDWGGGDILYYADRYMEKSVDPARFAAPKIIAENMQNGHIGMKSGKGFYDYSGRDVLAYQQETMRKFIDLLRHIGLLPAPGEQYKL